MCWDIKTSGARACAMNAVIVMISCFDLNAAFRSSYQSDHQTPHLLTVREATRISQPPSAPSRGALVVTPKPCQLAYMKATIDLTSTFTAGSSRAARRGRTVRELVAGSTRRGHAIATGTTADQESGTRVVASTHERVAIRTCRG